MHPLAFWRFIWPKETNEELLSSEENTLSSTKLIKHQMCSHYRRNFSLPSGVRLPEFIGIKEYKIFWCVSLFHSPECILIMGGCFFAIIIIWSHCYMHHSVWVHRGAQLLTLKCTSCTDYSISIWPDELNGKYRELQLSTAAFFFYFDEYEKP